MICNSLLHLLSHPAQLGLVSADPGLLPDAVAEPLRLEPAAAVGDQNRISEWLSRKRARISKTQIIGDLL